MDKVIVIINQSKSTIFLFCQACFTNPYSPHVDIDTSSITRHVHLK